jgi:hypothetical protein
MKNQKTMAHQLKPLSLVSRSSVAQVADRVCAKRVWIVCIILLCGYGIAGASGSQELVRLTNYLGPITLLVSLSVIVSRVLIANPLYLWTPIPWFLSVSAIFLGLGPLVFTFGNDTTIYSMSYLPIDLFRTNVLNAVGLACVFGAYALTARFHSRSFTGDRDDRTNASAETAAFIFLGIGLPFNYFIVLPYEFGLLPFVLPGSLFLLGQLVGLGLFMVGFLSARDSRWRLFLYSMAALELTIAFLRFNKSVLVFVPIMIAIGQFMATRKLWVLFRGAAFVVVIYLVACPIVSNARLRIYDMVGNHYQIPLRERIGVAKAALVDFVHRDSSTSNAKQVWWTRLCYAHMQTFAMDAFDEGRPGDSYSNAAVVVIPRVLWPDKPNITAIAMDFNEQMFGSRGSSTGCGFFAEAYWNGGWPMVIFVCTGVGVLFAWLSRLMIVRMARNEWLFLPCAFIGIKMGMSVDGFLVPSYIGASAIYVAYYSSIRFLYAKSSTSTSTRTSQQRKNGVLC